MSTVKWTLLPVFELDAPIMPEPEDHPELGIYMARKSLASLDYVCVVKGHISFNLESCVQEEFDGCVAVLTLYCADDPGERVCWPTVLVYHKIWGYNVGFPLGDIGRSLLEKGNLRARLDVIYLSANDR